MSSFVSGPGEFYTTNLNPPSITIQGLSTDTKPSAVTFQGYYFYETDTQNTYLAYNGTWNQVLKATSSSGSGTGSGIGSKFTANGGGSTFIIPHGLGTTPTFVEVGAGSADARGNFSWTSDNTNITVTYPIATPAGTNNIILWWTAGTLSSPISVTGGINTSSGSATQSGNASTTVFNIPHGLTTTPSNVVIEPNSVDALGDFTWTVNATNIVLTYQVAPPSGTNNLTWNWIAATSTASTLQNMTIDAGKNAILQGGEFYYTIYIDPNDSNKIKARNNVTGAIDSSNANPTTTFQAALTNLQSTGGGIFVRQGTYSITTGLTYTGNNLYVLFEGGAIIQPTAPTSADIWTINGNDNIIEGMVLDQSLMSNGAGSGINIGGTSTSNRCKVFNCYLISPSTSGIILNSHSGGAFIYDNHIQAPLSSPTANGIYVNSSSDHFVHHNDVGGYLNGILLNGASVCRVESNEVYSNTTGIQAYLTKGCIIIGNNIQSNKGNGLFVKSDAAGTWTGPIISGNTIRNNSQNPTNTTDGILLIGTAGTIDDCIVVGNNIYDDQVSKTQRYGITVNSAIYTNLLIQGNAVGGNNTGSINLQSTPSASNISVNNNPGFTTDNTLSTQTNKTIDAEQNTLTHIQPMPSVYRTGVWQGINKSGTGAGDGLFVGDIAFTATGTISGIDAAAGVGAYTKFDTTTTSTTQVGIRDAASQAFKSTVQLNPEFKFAFQANNTTNCRFFVVISNNAAFQTGDEPLANNAGVAFGFRSTDTNWVIERNNGGATGTFDTSPGFGALDTNSHVLTVTFNGSTNIVFKLDNSTATYTTSLPSLTTKLAFQVTMTNTTAASNTFNLWWVQLRSDK